MPKLYPHHANAVDSKLVVIHNLYPHIKVFLNIDYKTPESKNTALLTAIFDGAIDIVKYLIELGADLECTNSLGRTPLMEALILNKPNIAEMLINSGANVNAQDNFGETPIMHAINGILNSPENILKLLLQKNANPNLEDYMHQSAIFKTIDVRTSKLECLKLLVTYGANINSQDIYGDTPLISAVRLKNINAIDLLLQFGADPLILNNDNESAISISLFQKEQSNRPLEQQIYSKLKLFLNK